MALGFQLLLDVAGALEAASSNSKRDPSIGPFPQQRSQPPTPPGSTSGSPRIGAEAPASRFPREYEPLPDILHPDSLQSVPFCLPHLGEFDRGVESLVWSKGTSTSCTPPSPLPGLQEVGLPQTLAPRRPSWPCTLEDSAPGFLPPLRATGNSLIHYAFSSEHSSPLSSGYGSPNTFLRYNFNKPVHHVQDGYLSPPPESENRHINQKYTTEQGDFIIYTWHDKKMKWQRIKQEFARRFGTTPERTVQGLQAWYYRMNQRIPIWDENGWLVFENEDVLEPKQISIKCRERDSQDKPMEPLGLAQRYPERLVDYEWVDAEIKRDAYDWANKRAMQYQERRERRRRKEHRRLKL
ncbi:hypothetical protein B0T10DRAFT_172540 [Thelonectria olida]|uniref:Uncharacterized protein n=1 Tax=Thelonectria olida TaxID=1576542 RepID=A0A9P8WEE9_9HYPO|nr:hypothetical protein B0T10DRAFT_172540 [Thelonectria olida]